MIVKVNHENLTYHLWENGYKINKKNFEVIPPNHYKIISIFLSSFSFIGIPSFQSIKSFSNKISFSNNYDIKRKRSFLFQNRFPLLFIFFLNLEQSVKILFNQKNDKLSNFSYISPQPLKHNKNMRYLQNKSFKTILFSFILVMSIFSLSSCKKDYIIYYNKVNEIDSIYRMANNPKLAIKEYREIFKEYTPKNQDRIEEYATYITLANQYKEDFGGKESLYQLISLIAPNGDEYKKYLPLFNKYGIDNPSVEQKITKWKQGLDKKLVDSFKIALIRDQEGRPLDTALTRKNVEKNAKLLIWTFKNYGFPTPEKIGWFPMPTFISHMVESKKDYPFIKDKLLEYVKSGDFSPRDYARMEDTYLGSHKKITRYGFNMIPVQDSTQTDRNRKSLGIPSMKHSAKIRKDYSKKLKDDNVNMISG